MTEKMKIHLVGDPLALDSLTKSGVVGAGKKLMAGGDIEEAVAEVEGSLASRDPVGFAVNETIKWKLYRALKGSKLFNFFGLDLYL